METLGVGCYILGRWREAFAVPILPDGVTILVSFYAPPPLGTELPEHFIDHREVASYV
jgi:hypothetical protein